MGYTSKTIEIIEKSLSLQVITSVVDLGAQNLYDQDYGDKYPYASEFYKKKEIEYICIDLNGENGAVKLNLSQQLPHGFPQHDLVVDAGTSEHVGFGKHEIKSFYNCLKAKHDLCKLGGLIVSENPKTGNWPGHGFNYYSMEFYDKLAKKNKYEIIELGEHPAMGNEVDGWNIYCIMRKKTKEFMSFTDFKLIPICTS